MFPILSIHIQEKFSPKRQEGKDLPKEGLDKRSVKLTLKGKGLFTQRISLLRLNTKISQKAWQKTPYD